MQVNLRIFIFCCCTGLLILSGCKTRKEQQSPLTPVVSSSSKKSNPEVDLKVKMYFLDACREKIRGNIELAEGLLKECIKLDPYNAAANYELANIYRFTGLYTQALKCAKVAALADSKNEWYNLLYIECLHNKRMYAEAIERYEILVQSNPYRADFYQGLASEYGYVGKPEKAIQTYNKMEEKLGFSPEISMQKVNLYRKLKKWNDAEAELKKLILEDGKDARYFTYLADLYQEEGQPQKALDTYREILQSEPNNPQVHLALWQYYRKENKNEEAFQEVKSVFLSPDLDIDNKINILVSYYTVTEQDPKYLPQAYELCKLLVDSNQSEPKAHAVYADFLYRDKKFKEASEELRKVLLYDKGKFVIWDQLMICEADMNQNDSLVKHSAEAMELFPNQARPYFFNGLGYMRLKKYDKAIKPFKEGKQFVYENIPLQVGFASNLGEVYHSLKDYEKSDAEFEEAITLDPDNSMVLNNYAYYLSLRKQKLALAEKYSKHSLEINPNNVSFLDTYGYILFQEGKYEESKTYFEKALDKGGFNRPAIAEHYGDVLYKLNQTEKAIEFWKKSRELGNTSELLNKKIAEGKYIES